MSRSTRVLVAGVLLGVLATGACSNDSDAEQEGPTVVEVTMVDNQFEFPELAVSVDQVVTFRFTNRGTVRHEAVIGDEMFQMGHVDHQHLPGEVMANSVMVEPGATVDLVYRFTQAGTVIIGCHEPGHYENGMRADIVVTG